MHSCLLALALLASGPTGSRSQSSRSPEFARTLTTNLGMQGRVMWIDATANIDRVCTIEGVRDVVAHCKKANISTLVVDVKPVSGQVVYASKIAEHMREWRGKQYPDFDVLRAFLDEGHKAGLEVCASLNIFAEGHKYFSVGLAYKKRDWQSNAYVVERSLIAGNGSKLLVRAEGEPEDAARPLVYTDDFFQPPTDTAGKQIAVVFDEDKKVAGVIDTALLDQEPLRAPEDGQMLVLENGAMDWATQHLRAGDQTRFTALGKRVPVTESPSEKVAAFVSPLHPEVRAYQIAILKEVAQNYEVDAIIFDRMRYANVYNDYSDYSRRAFERWLGKSISRWPEDVISYSDKPGAPIQRGKLFKPWLEFRARVIREFAREVTETIRAIRPGIQFGAYVGSWFTEYYGVGVNWGSDKFPVRTSWASPSYNEAGYAEFLNWISTGCYYGIPTKEEARAVRKEEGGTVEAAAELSTAVVSNSIPVYAGLYCLNYQDRPKDFARAVAAAVRHSQGVMIFDLSYIYDYNWWPILEEAFAKPMASPHRATALNGQLRAVQDAIRSAQDSRATASRLPAVPYQPGGG
jgi:uncharacterized lipoprotein YddW (UPF0748 family)